MVPNAPFPPPQSTWSLPGSGHHTMAGYQLILATLLRKSRLVADHPRMTISAINADAFVSEVLGGGQVWTIRDKDGFPTSTNASGETVMPFWSSEKRARQVIDIIPAYRDFEPAPIELSVFVKRWLPGLSDDGLYCGLNWSGNRATGYDLTPVDVLTRLTAR